MTSGNTGIGLAFVAAVKGYQLTCVLPSTVSDERKTLLLAMGAKVVLTNKADGVAVGTPSKLQPPSVAQHRMQSDSKS